MSTLGMVLLVVGTLWIVVNAFGQSVLWGLGALLLPLVALIFAVMNFAENKLPLLLWVVGAVMYVMGGGFAPGELEMPAEM